MAGTNINTLIPSASDIDYSDTAEICGYQLLLCKMFERAGGLSYPRIISKELRTIRNEGLIWLKEVKRLFTSILEMPMDTSLKKRTPDLGNIPELLSSYSFFYRICYGGPCFDYLHKVRLKTATKWLNGDKSISETDVVLLLLQEISLDNKMLENRYSDFGTSVMGIWIDELCRYGQFQHTPYAEALKRLRFLLDNDLFAYLGHKKQRQIKTEWTNTYTVDDFTSLDTPTLSEYIGFILIAIRKQFYHCENDDEQYIRLWSEYASRPEINHFAREAFAIDLGIRQEMLVG